MSYYGNGDDNWHPNTRYAEARTVKAVNVSPEVYNEVLRIRQKIEDQVCDKCGHNVKPTIKSVADMLIKKGLEVLKDENTSKE